MFSDGGIYSLPSLDSTGKTDATSSNTSEVNKQNLLASLGNDNSVTADTSSAIMGGSTDGQIDNAWHQTENNNSPSRIDTDVILQHKNNNKLSEEVDNVGNYINLQSDRADGERHSSKVFSFSLTFSAYSFALLCLVDKLNYKMTNSR